MMYVARDILTLKSGYIVHQTNCVGTKPFGLSADMERTFPGTCPYYLRDHPSIPGTVFLIQSSKGPIVVNLFGQYYPGGPGRKGDEVSDRVKYFNQALDGFIEHLSGTEEHVQIAFPYKIGCGLAQGDWNVYEKMLTEFDTKLKQKGIDAEVVICYK